MVFFVFKLYTMHEPSYLCKVVFNVFMWFEMLLTQIITWAYKKFLSYIQILSSQLTLIHPLLVYSKSYHFCNETL